jgi:hypothetical protein
LKKFLHLREGKFTNVCTGTFRSARDIQRA